MGVILDIGIELVDVNRRTYRATEIDVGRIGRQTVRSERGGETGQGEIGRTRRVGVWGENRPAIPLSVC